MQGNSFRSVSPAPSRRSMRSLKSAVSGKSRRSLDSGFYEEEIIPTPIQRLSEAHWKKPAVCPVPPVPTVRFGELSLKIPPVGLPRPPSSKSSGKLRQQYSLGEDNKLPPALLQAPSTASSYTSSDGEEAWDCNINNFVDDEAMDVADGVWISWNPKDITIHLDIDVHENLEPELEEFSRLVRLGRFGLAQEFFDKKLFDQGKNPFIMVQYLYMLLSKGDYRAVHALRCNGPYDDELVSLWSIIKERGNLRSRHRRNLDEFVGITGPKSRTSISVIATTTTVRLGLLQLSYDREVGRRKMSTLADGAADRAFSCWGSIDSLLESFVREGRIWDYRDLVMERQRQFGTPTAVEIHAIWEHWFVQSYDESTYLAMLDMLACVVLTHASADSELIMPGKRGAVERGEHLARAIATNDPESMRSRPYMNWILARAVLSFYGSRYGVTHTPERFHQHPGLLLTQPRVIFIPIYIPADDEDPGWPAVDALPSLLESVRMGLELAKELEDYSCEALFRKLLVHLSPFPLQELETLATFQRVVQGDMIGTVETTLSAYLFAHSTESKEWLRRQILEQDQFLFRNFHPALQAIREMVLRALTKPEDRWTERRNDAVPTWEDIPESLYPHLREDLFSSLPPPPREDISRWFDTVEKQPPAAASSSDASDAYWIPSPTIQPGNIFMGKLNVQSSDRERSHILLPGFKSENKGEAIPPQDSMRRKPGNTNKTSVSAPQQRSRVAFIEEIDEETGSVLEGTALYATLPPPSRQPVEDLPVRVPMQTTSADFDAAKETPLTNMANITRSRNRGLRPSNSKRTPSTSPQRGRSGSHGCFDDESSSEAADDESSPAKSTHGGVSLQEHEYRQHTLEMGGAPKSSSQDNELSKAPGIRNMSREIVGQATEMGNGLKGGSQVQVSHEKPSGMHPTESSHSLSTIVEMENENRGGTDSVFDESDVSLEKNKLETVKKKSILRKRSRRKSFDLAKRLSISLEDDIDTDGWNDSLNNKKLRPTDGLNPLTSAFFKKERDAILSKGYETDPEKASRTFMRQIEEKREERKRLERKSREEKQKGGEGKEKKKGITFSDNIDDERERNTVHFATILPTLATEGESQQKKRNVHVQAPNGEDAHVGFISPDGSKDGEEVAADINMPSLTQSKSGQLVESAQRVVRDPISGSSTLDSDGGISGSADVDVSVDINVGVVNEA